MKLVRDFTSRRDLRARMARGFTLVEMMVVITLLAILFGLAIPSFTRASLSSKLNAIASSLVASTQIARSEAVKRNVPVRMCASTDGATCGSSGGWEVGWILLLPDDTVLQHQQALPTEFRIAESGGTVTLSFPPSIAGATTATFTICRATPLGGQNRVVEVTATDNTRVAHNTVTTCP